MPSQPFIPSRISADFTDWQKPAPGAADTGKAWVWDDEVFMYVPDAFDPAGTAASLVGTHESADNPHGQYVLMSATRAAILASTPTLRSAALSTDTLEMFIWDGSTWYVAPLELIEQANAVDMGLQPPMVQNDRAGYSADYITDKSIFNSRVLGSDVDEEGSIRTSSGELQVYLSGEWQTAVTGFRFREDDNGGYELEHRPIGFDWWIEVLSGNSDELGLNGLPLAQQYSASMGAYPAHVQIVGREITA